MLLLGCLAVVGCDGTHHVNGAVHVAEGARGGDVITVNGSVQIGARARVADVRSVNGSQSLGEDARAGSMSAVNGSIAIGARAVVTGDVDCVNGSLNLAPGSQIGGNLANINGAVTVDGAQVGGLLRTENGSITLLHGARISGGILVKKPHGVFVFDKLRPPRVVIGRDVTVNGTLKFERKVRLYVSDQVAHIGSVEGATPISYQGASPPE